MISAHRVNDAIGGGELRLSLSSALDSHHPEAFRCPLFPTDRANDVAGMLIELLQDCHVTDIQVLPGIHADCDKGPDAPLLFRADALAALDRAARH